MGSTQSHIDRGPITVTNSSVGASDWRKLDGVFSQFSMQAIPSTNCTAFASALQGTVTTNSTTPLELAATVALTGAVVTTTETALITHVRVNSSVMTSGSVSHYIVALP